MDAVIAVVTDLLFQSRIAAAARHTGAEVRYVRSLADLPAEPYRLALIDLDADLDVMAAIRRLAGQGKVVAFGPHLDTNRRKEARAAGAGRVLAKSKFVGELPALLASG